MGKLLSLDSPEAMSIFKDIEVIYTDLDGTLFAPKGRFLVDYAGNPSTQNAEAVSSIQALGIKLIIVTGRNRTQGNEISKIMNIDGFISEMGTAKQSNPDQPFDIEYDTGDFEWDPELHANPYEAIAASGAIEALMQKYPQKIEPNTPWAWGRDVTHSLRGQIDAKEATEYLHGLGFALDVLDNGKMSLPGKNLKDCEYINGYHVLPSNTSKELAVMRDIESKGYDAAKTVSIGDSLADVAMGKHTGSFVLMANGMDSEKNIDAAEALECPAFHTTKRCCDGWAEFAKAICIAKDLD